MSAIQPPLAPAQAHRNQQLFSDYYLNMIVSQRVDWQQLAQAAAPVMRQVKAILDGFAPSSNEAQTEEGLIKPVLALLGHTFEVQPALATPGGTKKPDYVLYRDNAALLANKNKLLDETLLNGRAFAVADAKYWDRPLDTVRGRGGAVLDNTNPAFQIAFYVQHSGVEWGMLSNGRLWRLYHRDTAYRLDRFYEVDLPELLARDDPQAWLYFYAFFHRSAFEPHDLGLSALLRASADYARGISENLKSQVYTALRHLAQGLLDYAPNGLQPDPATLQTIYDHCLIVLYRLLFILYAEARELLPLRESERYRRQYSLHAIKRQVVADLYGGEVLLADSDTLWSRLRALFRIIDKGSPPLQVATFNGGLFDPAHYPFLEQHSVGDARLQQAIALLTQVNRQFVDYRDLAERHLGSIYEGLLEHHLQPVTSEAGWTIDLFNDKGERHRTGSYYTPDFVVQYIIDQTLKPLLDAAVAGKQSDAERIAAVLATNVLDPAMGSGHFPVAATEYIARYLVDLGVVPGTDAGAEADLAYWKRRVAQSCIYGVDLNPLAVDLAKLSLWLATAAKNKPLSFLDHHLRVGNALVGARIAEGEPRKRGDKQGKRRSVQVPSADQLSMLDDPEFARSMSTAVGSMWLIEETAGNTIDEVRAQERLYADLRATLSRQYRHLADVAAAREFGLAVDATLWKGLSDYLQRAGGFALPQFAALLDAATAEAGRQRFFHWDLEFPEVFFDRHGRPLGQRAGFDAVIGNPPYVRQEALAPIKPYLAQQYAEVYHGVADLYVYFYQQGVRLLREGGRMSYIVTNKWLRAGYGEPLRGYFAEHAAIEQIIDFGHAPIFEDVDVFPCIIVLAKPETGDAIPADQQVQVTSFPREALRLVQLDGYVRRFGHAVAQRRLGRAAWSLETSDVDDLMEKIKRAGVPLAEFAGVKPYYGIKTGLNEAFLIDTPTKERLVREDPRSAEIIKPYLRGQDIKRWSPEWAGLWMIFTGYGVDINSYHAVEQHLNSFRGALEKRAGSQKWWQIQAVTAAYHLFSQPKIMYQEIQFHSQYCLDITGILGNNKTFIIPSGDLYLVAVLNSPLMWSHNWRFLPHMKDEALNPAGFLMEQLPIAPPSDAIRAEVEPAAARLIAITRADQEARRDTLDWLRTEFGIETPGQRLESFAALNSDAFVEEVRKRRPKAAARLTPAALRDLRTGYTEQATPVQQRQTEAQMLERRLADLVNAAYNLSPDDIDLLWRTAPPRMPVGRGEA